MLGFINIAYFQFIVNTKKIMQQSKGWSVPFSSLRHQLNRHTDQTFTTTIHIALSFYLR